MDQGMRTVERALAQKPETDEPRDTTADVLTSAVVQSRYRSKTDLVYELLREAVLTGELEPGQRINVDGLAIKLGLSKIPIREALGQLAAEGLVTLKRHVGASVANPLSPREIRNTFAVRANLEEMAAATAAREATLEELAALRAFVEETHAHALSLDRTGWGKLNRDFHYRLAVASHNELLTELCLEVINRSIRFRGRLDATRRVRPRLVEEHYRIIDAIERGDAVVAGALARRHLEASLEDVLNYLAELDSQPNS